MIEKIVEISQDNVKLYTENEQLVIKKEENEIYKVPLIEMGVLLISTPYASISTALISKITKNKGLIVTTDRNYMPVGLFLPYELNYIQYERFQYQINSSLPLKKQLWKQIVTAKIKTQGLLLKKYKNNDYGLLNISEKVLSGDSSNLEAYSSKIYWKELFGENFRRDRKLPGINSILNYGYTILRAMVARSICASGLNPTLGIFHRNKYNSFSLADDLMEPFRFVVDELTYKHMIESGIQIFLAKDLKRKIIEGVINKKFEINKKIFSLNETLFKVSASLVNVYSGNEKKLFLPDFYEKDRDSNKK